MIKKYILLVLFPLITVSCANLSLDNKIVLFTDIQNLHIDEETTYPDSPFGHFVEQTFSKENNPENKIHYLNVLNIGDDALLSRIHLIRNAQKAIYIQTYIWANDESGRYVLYELLEAAKRGVKVKIIIDQWLGDYPGELLAYLSQAHKNLEIKHYSPHANQIKPTKLRLLGELAVNFKQVNQRMHNKIFIIDDRIAITGGRNYQNDYFDRGETRNFKDRDVIVVGPVVRKMTESFMLYWAYRLSIPCQDLVDVEKLLNIDKFKRLETRDDYDLKTLFQDTDKLASDYNFIEKHFIDEAFKISDINFVVDSPGKNNSFGLAGGSIVTDELVKFLSTANNSIVVQTPYVVLDDMLTKSIKKIRRKKKSLDILISSNSLAATDNIYAYSFSYKLKKLYVKKLRFRIFELRPVPDDISLMMPRYKTEQSTSDDTNEDTTKKFLPSQIEKIWIPFNSFFNNNEKQKSKQYMCIHAKSFIIDHDKVWVGSFNLDPRSAHLNSEVALIINDKAVANSIEKNILRDMAPQNSWTIGKRKDVPLISQFSGILSTILQYVPFVDIWPFRYTASFELKQDYEPVPFYHKDFYDNYISVGSFPQVNLSIKEIQIRLLKAFAGIAKPVI